MSGTRNLEVLARLRRMELDRTKRSLADASRAILEVEQSALTVWSQVTIPTDDTERARAVHVRGEAVQTARLRSDRFQAELGRLASSRRSLEERARQELLSCRQLEIVVERQIGGQRRCDLRRLQRRSDELAGREASADR